MLNKEEEEKTDTQKSIEQSFELYEQLKNSKPNPDIKYTRKYIEEVFGNLYKNSIENEKGNISNFGWTHNIWEDKGEKFSAWTFKTDRGTFTTGDKGKEEFDKIMKEEFNKLPNLTNDI